MYRSYWSVWAIFIIGSFLFFSSCSGCIRGGKEILKPKNIRVITKALPKSMKIKKVPFVPATAIKGAPLAQQMVKNASIEFKMIDKAGKVVINQAQMATQANRLSIQRIMVNISDDILASLQHGKKYTDMEIRKATINTLQTIIKQKKNTNYAFNLNIPTGNFQVDIPQLNNQYYQGATNLYALILGGATLTPDGYYVFNKTRKMNRWEELFWDVLD